MYWLAAASSSSGSRDRSTLLDGCFDAKRLFGLGPTVHSGVTRSAERLLVEEACTPIHEGDNHSSFLLNPPVFIKRENVLKGEVHLI
jgi:hypothetical protein